MADHRTIETTAPVPMSGWGRLNPVEQSAVSPEAPDDLQAWIPHADQPVIARGMGRSYGDPAVCTGGQVILQDGLKSILSFDVQSGLLKCQSGVTLGEIIARYLPEGWFPAVVPGTQFVTIGGAIASDVHGKNHHQRGTFSEALLSFRLLTAAGDILECSREQNPELFWATTGGMGLTGIVLDATLQLDRRSSAWVNIFNRRTGGLDETLELMAELDEYAYSVAWIDCLARGSRLGRSVVSYGSDAAPAELPTASAASPLMIPARRRLAVPVNFPNFTLNRLSISAFNALYYRLPRPAEGLQALDGLHFPLDAILHWNRIYGRRGFVQFQGFIPDAAAGEYARKILEATSATGMASFLAVFKRTGVAGPGLLTFPDRGYSLAMDFPNVGERLQDLMRALHTLLIECGGRVYLAKDAVLDTATFNAMYARADEFREIRARIDPNRRFVSDQARRIGL